MCFSAAVDPACDLFAWLEPSRCAGGRYDSDELLTEDGRRVRMVLFLEDVEFAESGLEAFAATEFGAVETGGVDADEDPVG